MLFKRHNRQNTKGGSSASAMPPRPAQRSLNRKSTILSGRTIAAKRERLETANERAAARKKDKRKSIFRFLVTSLCFAAIVGVLFVIYSIFTKSADDTATSITTEISSYPPTIEIVDEDTGAASSSITSRMKEYVGRAEASFRDKGYQPQRAVIPSTSIREIRLHLDGYDGYIKMIIDRDPAVSVEDADRMIRYLKEIGVESFKYIDVRIDGRAYWKGN